MPAAKAAMEEAHAHACERGQWILNDKRLLADTGLEHVIAAYLQLPSSMESLQGWVDEFASMLTSGPVVPGDIGRRTAGGR